MSKNRQNYDREYYTKNKQRILNRKKNSMSKYLRHCKNRAKEKNLEFDLTAKALESKKVTHCPILKIELSYTNNTIQNNSATIDRIDNSKGYTIENIQIVSYQANRMKSNASQKELIEFAKYILEEYGGN